VGKKNETHEDENENDILDVFEEGFLDDIEDSE
jgi:hypothetical protein